MATTHPHDSLRPEVIRARVTEIAPRNYVTRQTILVEPYNTNVLKYVSVTDRGNVAYIADNSWPTIDEVVHTKNTTAEILRFGGKFTVRYDDLKFGTVDNLVNRNLDRLTRKITKFEDELISAELEKAGVAAGGNKVVATTTQWTTSANVLSNVANAIELIDAKGFEANTMIVNQTSYRYLLQSVTATTSDRALAFVESGKLSQYQGLPLLKTNAETFGNADATNDDVFLVQRGAYGWLAEVEPLSTVGPLPIEGVPELAGVYICAYARSLPVVDQKTALAIIQDVF